MTSVSHISQDEPQSSLPKFLTQEWLEPRFVVVTLVALIISAILESREASPELILFFNLLMYFTGGLFGTISALKALFEERKVEVDMLMILAALGAAYIGEWQEGATLLFLFSLSNVLQDYAIGRSRRAIKSLLKLYPNEATLRMPDGKKRVVKVDEIQLGDIILIEPGERIPVDGVVKHGISAVDQSPVTGESIPVDKAPGSKVFAGTLNAQGALDVEATAKAKDTMLARIIRLVEEAQDSKTTTEVFLEKFEEYYAVLVIVGVTLFIAIQWFLGVGNFEDIFYRAMVLMTVASPCALVISTPASFISAIASAARAGVLFKGSAYIEKMAGIKAVAFDKTGTLTSGKPRVTQILPADGVTLEELLRVAASAEDRSQHPLAKAVVAEALTHDIHPATISGFASVMGRGVEVTLDGQTVRVGNPDYVAESAPLPDSFKGTYAALAESGSTVIAVARGDTFLGAIAIADEIRAESVEAIKTLHKLGIKVVMLTGDNARVAANIAKQAGVDDVYAELLPEDKANIIRDVQAKYGRVVMVGDGVNDAPAMATADVGIAMGAAGTDVALETADVVLMGDRLDLIPFALSLSRKAYRVVWQNLSFSIGVIVLLVISTFFFELTLPLGVLGHEGSTVIVVLNGLIQLLLIPTLQYQRSEQRQALTKTAIA